MNYVKALVLVFMLVILSSGLSVAGAGGVANTNLEENTTTFPGFRGPATLSHTAPQDPIRPHHPHNHNFFCNTTTNSASTLETLMAGETTCRRPQDVSAYWSPELKIGDKILKPSFSGLYWQTIDGLDPRKTVPMPDGLRMIASDANGDISWACTVDQNKGNVQPNLPQNCSENSNGIGVRVTFPECWDGEPAGSDKEHSVIEAVERQNGERSCPASHPKQFPTLTMWPDYPGDHPSGPMSVSMGIGEWGGESTMHADVFVAFKSDVMERLVEKCINPYVDREERPAVCDGNVFFK